MLPVEGARGDTISSGAAIQCRSRANSASLFRSSVRALVESARVEVNSEKTGSSARCRSRANSSSLFSAARARLGREQVRRGHVRDDRLICSLLGILVSVEPTSTYDSIAGQVRGNMMLFVTILLLSEVLLFYYFGLCPHYIPLFCFFYIRILIDRLLRNKRYVH